MLKTIVLLLAISYCAYADLPVHCVRHQVVGLWNVVVTEPAVVADGQVPSCGHKQPDDPNQSWQAGLDSFSPSYNFQFQLNDDFTAEMIEGNTTTQGNWTMIYDEGLDVIFDTERFTNFFYYYPVGKNDHQSNCGKTTVGWYSNNKTEKACWKAEKVLASGEQSQDLVSNQTEQKNIVQPDYLMNPSENNENSEDDPSGPAPAPSFLEIQSKGSVSKRRARHSSRQASLDSQSSEETENQQANSKYSKDFKDHDEIVQNLNNIPEKSWTAKAHPQYASKSLADLNGMAGRKTSVKASKSGLARSVGEDVSDLPKQFSWSNMLGQPRQQLDCGSCYLVATLQMLEARLKIKHNEQVTLSIQHPLDCSYYNQGCEGGYPYLVGLFATEYELVPETCAPYLARVDKCGTCDVSQLNKTYKVSDFRFVGGSYGNCSERAMMLELMNNGPMVVSFEPTNDFMYYHGGIYHSVDAEWMKNGNDKPEWEKVDHSVLMYGWGENQYGQKYWIVRNSWGPDWGENGDFRIKRGVDESAIESLGEAADPIIVYKNN